MTEEMLQKLSAALGTYNQQFPEDTRSIIIRQDGSVAVSSVTEVQDWFVTPVAQGLNDLLGITE